MSLNKYSIKKLAEKLVKIPSLKGLSATSILKEIPFFSEIKDTTLRLDEITDSIVINEYDSNYIICRHGKLDERFHIILNGSVRAIIPTEGDARYELFRLGVGDFFGEDLIISQEPRVNTIITSEETITISVTSEVLRRLLSESKKIKAIMDKRYIERKLRTDLRRIPIFTHMSESHFNEVLNEIELLTMPKGKVVFNEGDDGDAFYLIRRGRIEVEKYVDGKKRLLNILSEGQFFGEMSLILKEKRSAAVKVSATAELVKISSDSFIKIVNKDPELKDKLLNIVCERKKTEQQVLKTPNIAGITRSLLDLNNVLYKHLDIISQCAVYTDMGSALLATFPGSRYPYVYPRDCACASRFLYKLLISPLKAGEIAFRLLEETSRFILNCQRDDGYWGQRYGINCEDRGIYIQEDNVAHGVTILCRYLLGAKRVKKDIPDVERIVQAIGRGYEYARKNYYRKGIHLFYSTTSIHESAIEEGYSIWVNHAYLLMLRLIERVGNEYGIKEKFTKEIELKDAFETTIDNVFNTSNRLARRLKPDGDIDIRPDITLMCPFYFATGMDVEYFNGNDRLTNSIKFVEDTLWDPVLGMLQRYLPFFEDPHTHIHAGNGPWIPYTSILAQYYFHIGKVDTGNDIIGIIDKYRSSEGYLCEHLTTPERFFEFKEFEWITGKDFEKELLTHGIMIPGIPYDFLVEELNHMKNAYDEIETECRENGDKKNIAFATPLMWSHAEYAMALMLKTEKEIAAMGSKEL
ncbi:MAG: cyclic nucleotide-binding domain-containing protein [Planctomycetes bacterium]|nr:cyclic nucleotide-binding domain-containing protein [Planctomycetota bacterium]